ncbi:hypothetical protein GCM10023322_03280 [Rugosimonospora acidiphila]|uniref:Uncharacterized protein n=1 Tax=Rugosimonospora acidiphila TaxID=556531 RepID=A0ABP9RIL4_9ACTN
MGQFEERLAGRQVELDQPGRATHSIKVVLDEPGPRATHVHGLEDPVATQDSEIIGAEDGALGWYNAATQHGDHSLRHVRQTTRPAPAGRRSPPALVG